MKKLIRNLFNKEGFLVFLILALIIVVRVVYLLNWKSFLDGDESLVGVMAKHITEGKSSPIYYYGQSYMGTLEQYGAAMLFVVFGASPFVLKLVPLLYYSLSLWLVSLIIQKYYKKAGSVYYLFFSVFPSLFVIVWSTKARGAYSEMVFLCILFLYFLFKFQEKPKLSYLYFLSIIFGFSVYLNLLCLPFYIVILILHSLDARKAQSVYSLVDRIKLFCISVVSFLIGYLPAIVYIFNNPGKDYMHFDFPEIGQIFDNIIILFSELIPLILGRYLNNFDQLSIFVIAELILFSLSLFAIITILLEYRKCFYGLLFFKKSKYPKIFYLIVIFFVYVVVLVFSPFELHMPNPQIVLQNSHNFTELVNELPFYLPLVRYMIFGIIIIPLMLFIAFNVIKEKSNKLASVYIWFVFCSGLVISSQTIFINDNQELSYTYKAFLVRKDYSELILFLNQHNLYYGFADYYDQWNINFISGERIRLATRSLPNYAGVDNRYNDYLELANRHSHRLVNIYYDTQVSSIQEVRKEYNKARNSNIKIINDFVVIY